MFCSSLVIHVSNRESLEKPPSYKICSQTSRSLYPLSINHFSRSLHLLLKDLGSEQILFSRRTCLYAILFLQWCEWHEEDWRYWWLPLGLTYKSVVTFPPRTETLTSKKLVEVWDHSAASSYRCSQRKKMSSMNVHCRYDFISISLKISSSTSIIKKSIMQWSKLCTKSYITLLL